MTSCFGYEPGIMEELQGHAPCPEYAMFVFSKITGMGRNPEVVVSPSRVSKSAFLSKALVGLIF